MPKMKTRKAAMKRFKRTGSGKILKGNAKRRHLLECKPSRKKRKMRKEGLVAKADIDRVKKMLPAFC